MSEYVFFNETFLWLKFLKITLYILFSSDGDDDVMGEKGVIKR